MAARVGTDYSTTISAWRLFDERIGLYYSCHAYATLVL